MISMKRMGLKLFSLCVLALGLVAFSATAAQAEGTWMVKGANLTSGSKPLTGKLVGATGTLLSTLGLNKVDFTCTAATLVNANLEKEGAISEASKNAKVKFSGCTTIINGTLAKACEPVSGAEKGVIVSEEGYALLKEHSTGAGVTEIVPKTGTVFAIIHMGEACSIGEEVKVFGKLTVKDSGGNKGLKEEKAIHTIEEFKALTELKVANAKSEGTATLDGKAEAELTSKEVWDGLIPGKVISSKGGEGGLLINTNPFDTEAEIIAGGGGGSCKISATFPSLASCTTTAATVTWLALAP